MRKRSGQKKTTPKEILPGTIRIKTKDLQAYEKTKRSWKKSSKTFPDAMLAIKLFKAHNNFKTLIDTKNPTFLKGQLSADGKPQGARIKILPDGRELDKAFPLLAPHLTIHDESSNHHWDVIYQNPSGIYSYLYTLRKKKKFTRKKYRIVEDFKKIYPRLNRNTYNALKNECDHLAVAMYTLLKTYMRLGNEIYYRALHHKGLATLKKKNISIDGNYVVFDYIAKDGVPTTIKEKFPDVYIYRLKKMLGSIPKSSFVFTDPNTGHPIGDSHFKTAFKQYCGREFYPHIVRSYYATKKVEDFLARNDSPTKEEIRALYLSIAEKLGHKRFVKKDGIWKESYNVTVNHYIKPELVERVKSVIIEG